MNKEEFIVNVYVYCSGDDTTLAEVMDATRKLERMYRSHGDEPVYDSIDRDRVREFILESRK